jgi:hypothetical protein
MKKEDIDILNSKEFNRLCTDLLRLQIDRQSSIYNLQATQVSRQILQQACIEEEERCHKE